MKKEQLQSESEKKAVVINALAETFGKHCQTSHQVWCLIHALLDLCEFAEERRYKYSENLPLYVRGIHEHLSKTLPSQVNTFNDLANDILSIIMLSAANAEGIILVNSKTMMEDLQNILSEHPC